jgi:DNA-binding IclR family transcriptional regulator
LGKVLLARNQYALDELAESGLQRFTDATVTEVEKLAEELTEVRRRGWAIETEELMSGEASLAAPIDDRRGVTVGAIAITGPVERICLNGAPRSDMVSYVREAARAISRDLGAIPW